MRGGSRRARFGYTIKARSLLAEPWTGAELLRYFGPRPVEQWFNMSSPRVKSGEIEPKRPSSAAALELMLADPTPVRRP